LATLPSEGASGTVHSPGRTLGALALCVCASAAGAQTDPLFPLLDCAALWSAMAGFRETYAVDSASPQEAQDLAERFRSLALSRSGLAPGAVDPGIENLIPVYATLIERYILDGEEDARDQFEWLATECQRVSEAPPPPDD